MTGGPIVVAIINTNPDIVLMLRIELERIGFIAIVIHIEAIKTGGTDLERTLIEHDPRVIVYDVAPPYDHHWRFLDHLRALPAFDDRQIVLTSVNVKRVREVVGTDATVYEIAGQPDDIGAVVRAVREASRARPIR